MYGTEDAPEAIDALFRLGVRLIADFGRLLGICYEAANLLLFVVLHPLLTLWLAAALAATLAENRRLRRRRRADAPPTA
jgi:hypothetical protein